MQLFKKIFLAVFLMLTTAISKAEVIVPVVWPFGFGDGQALYLKVLLDQANGLQNKYKFILEQAPGAGGSIATKKIIGQQTPMLLAHTSAFFIRSNTHNEYSTDSFKILLPMSVSPLALLSHHSQLMPGKSYKFGVVGVGSTTHLISTKVLKKYPNSITVPYQTLTGPCVDVQGKHVDLCLDFLGSAKKRNNLNIIGITGSDSVNNTPALSSLGYSSDLNYMSAPLVILTVTDINDKLFAEMQQILIQAHTNNIILDNLYEQDSASRIKISKELYTQWYKDQQKFWNHLIKSSKISIQ